jgi:hypothetical protein
VQGMMAAAKIMKSTVLRWAYTVWM